MRFRKDTDGFRARESGLRMEAGGKLEVGGGEGMQVRDVCWAMALPGTLETLIKLARDVTSRNIQVAGVMD